MSHLDYSNSLYNGLPAITMDKLQITQNLAAKVILNLPKFASATIAMFELHWLPIRQRIKYKLTTIVFKCLSTNYKAPNYLTNLLVQLPKLKRNLRSSMNSSNKLVVPFVKKKTFAKCSFSVTAPRIWNDLPDNLREGANLQRTFKTKLKTHLFIEIYC